MQTLADLTKLLAMLIGFMLSIPAAIFMWKQLIQSKQNEAYRALKTSFVVFVLLIAVAIFCGTRLVLLLL